MKCVLARGKVCGREGRAIPRKFFVGEKRRGAHGRSKGEQSTEPGSAG